MMIDLFLPTIVDGEDKSSVLGNRIRKTYRHVRKWAKRTQTNCFRLYDGTIPQYPVAIDFYNGRFCIHYFSKTRLDQEPPVALVAETNQALGNIFGISDDLIFWRTRIKSKTTRQYEKLNDKKNFFLALEYGVKFWVNLEDYLDTGLFLDHRETRQYVASISEGKRLLNLFAYTCSFSVHAAKNGAVFTKSVDMSNTYTEWGKENFLVNGLSLKTNPIIRADCLKFLPTEAASGEKYDIIVIDPPTVSRSKKMDQLFDIHEDYVFLIKNALKILSKDGVIIFSSNSRKFKFDKEIFANCLIIEITNKLNPVDFPKQNLHRCWKISKL